MKIKQEFWNLIKSGKKTIELRKVDKLQELLSWFQHDSFCEINNKGRFKIPIYDYDPEKDGCDCINKNRSYHECEPNIIGHITINGYEIIKNPFKNEYLLNLKKQCINNDIFEGQVFLKIGDSNFNNIKWIVNNWDWLANYFKDEEEILVLKIESWKE